MMLPLWTRVTEGSFWSRAQFMALRTMFRVPVEEMGLIPMPESDRMLRPSFSRIRSMMAWAISLPCSKS